MTTIAKASYWGAGFFGAITLIAGTCLYYFGSVLGYRVSTIVALIVGYPSNLLIHALGFDQPPMLKIVGILNGCVFATLVNALIGGLVFALLRSISQSLGKRDRRA
jgi:hypothetical protein